MQKENAEVPMEKQDEEASDSLFSGGYDDPPPPQLSTSGMDRCSVLPEDEYREPLAPISLMTHAVPGSSKNGPLSGPSARIPRMGGLTPNYGDALNPLVQPSMMMPASTRSYAPEYRIKPREYDGTSNWKVYLHYFERVVELNKWGHKKLQFLWIHCKGEALDYLEELPTEKTQTYEEVCHAMDQRFGSERMSTIFRAEP